MSGIKDQSNLGFWSEKPYWCQPWSIVLFGSTVIFIILYLTENIFFRSLFILPVLIWWLLFLIIAPNIYNKEP